MDRLPGQKRLSGHVGLPFMFPINYCRQSFCLHREWPAWQMHACGMGQHRNMPLLLCACKTCVWKVNLAGVSRQHSFIQEWLGLLSIMEILRLGTYVYQSVTSVSSFPSLICSQMWRWCFIQFYLLKGSDRQEWTNAIGPDFSYILKAGLEIK